MVQDESLRVLVVGGAGHVGTIISPALEDRHAVRYFDLEPVPGAADRTVIGSVTDAAAVERAVADVDAVVYLAMGRHHDTPGGPDKVQSQFDVNAQGVYRVLAQAMKVDVRRFIYASSMSVFTSGNRPPRIDESYEPDCWHEYGLTKRLGERVCEIAGLNHPEATIVGLRLVLPLNETQYRQHVTNEGKGYHKAYPLGPKDTQRLFLAALALDRPGVHMIHSAGDITGERYSIDTANQLLGWRPEGV